MHIGTGHKMPWCIGLLNPACVSIDCFQGKLVADYDVTRYFKAYVGAINSLQNSGISEDLDYEKCCL